MEVGIFPADPRGIASPDAKVVGVSLKLGVEIEALVPLVISAAKMLILNMLVRQPAMYPQVVVSSVSRGHRRGNSGGKNSHHAQCFYDCHWSSPAGEAARMNNHIHQY
jgi:hypothetical protein